MNGYYSLANVPNVSSLFDSFDFVLYAVKVFTRY